MNKRMSRMVLALAIVFGGIFIFNAIRSFLIKRFFANFEPPAVSVSSVIAKARSWHPDISAVGNFEAISGVEINAETAGKIIAIHFNSGQYVPKDAPLIDLDDRVEQATLQFNQAELTLQKINYQRQLDLSKRGATPSSSVDEARAKLLQAQANVDKTQAEIAHKHLTAPFAGRVGIRQVNMGQYVTPGQTDVVTLQSLDPLYLKFYLPEQLLPQLHINQAITFAVEQYPGVLFEGIITALNAKVDINTHNIELQARLANCPTEAMNSPQTSPLVTLKKQTFNRKPVISCNTSLNTEKKITDFGFTPGMFASIEVEQPPIENVIVLPTTAISYSLYGDSVYVIEQDKDHPKDKQGQDILRVKRVFVKTGDQKGNYTVITSGVTTGQVVVSSGELKLQDGTRIVINNSVALADSDNMKELGQ